MRYLLTFILLTALLLPFSGCTAPDVVVTPDKPEANGQSFVWKISSGDNFVYLLGSVHAADADIYPLAAPIENAFEMSDKLVVELNILEVSPLKAALLLTKYGTYPEGEGLQDNLPEDLYARLRVQFKELGVSLDILDNYRPWAIVTTMEELAIQEAGYTEEYGIDLYFLNRAIDSGVEVVELETAEYQIELLSSISDETMVRLLVLGLEDPLEIEDLEFMFQAWEDGDAARMEELMFGGLAEEPAVATYYDVLLTQRNYNMLEKIEEFLADDDVYFIVVGAGHLVGEEGLLNLLEEKGYTLEQLAG
jgi:uncharacterized protein YbaP (TraB family)